MSLNIDANILNKAMKDDLKSMLMEIIDNQLTKPDADMDCGLIEECTDMLLQLEQEENDGMAVLIPLTTPEKLMSMCTSIAKGNGWKHLSRGARAAIAACIVLFSAMTANATVKAIYDVDVAKEVAQAVSTKLKDWGILANAEDTESIAVDVPTTTQPTTVKPEEALTAAIHKNLARTPAQPTAANSNTAVNGGVPVETTEEKHNIDIIEGGDFDETTKPTKPTTTKHNIDIIEGGDFDDEPTTQPPTEPSTEPLEKYYHRLFLDPAGGTCDTPFIVVREGKAIGQLPVPSRNGYVFNGWYNEALKYKKTIFNKNVPLALTDDTYYTLETDATATAQWLECFNIELDANGGQCNIGSISTYDTEKYYGKLPKPVREGYVFLGWYESLDGDDEAVDDSTAADKKKGKILFARWAVNDFTITLDPNGGDCDVETVKVKNSEALPALPIPKRPGYIFAGWFAGKSTTSQRYEEGMIYGETENITIYAMWTDATYVLTFDPNGGACDTQSKTVYSGLKVGELPVCVRPGYRFRGWEDSSGNAVTENTTYHYDRDLTVKAKWTLAAIPIKLDPNGGYGSVEEIRPVYTSAMVLPENLYKEGCMFDGWYTQPEGGEKINNGDSCKFTETVTLYAHWVETNGTCMVEFHSDSATDEITRWSVKAGEPIGQLPTAKSNVGSDFKPFISFIGWYDDDGPKGKKVDADYIVTEDTVLYAKWQLKYQRVAITSSHTVYSVGEAFDYNSVVVSVNFNFVMSIPVFEDMRKEAFEGYDERWQECFLNLDMDTLGAHTYDFRFSDYLGELGLLVIEGQGTYSVVDCTHNGAYHYTGRVEPTCTTDGKEGTKICNECGAVIEEGKVIPALGHDSDMLVGRVLPTGDGACPGYSGDKRCSRCNKLMEEGHLLGEHGENADTVNYNPRKPTCASPGYTGDVYCEHCHKKIGTGEVIPALNHIDENGNSGIVEMPGIEPTCTDDGCKPYQYCVLCNSVVGEIEILPALGHDGNGKSELVGYKPPTCGEDGYTGDWRCIFCSKLMKKGEVIPALGHDENTVTVVHNAYDPTLCTDGYTGDVCCAECGKILEEGAVIEKLGDGTQHGDTVRINAKEPTCGKAGYTGDLYCNDCGKIIEKGKTVPALGHDENTVTTVRNKKEPTCGKEGYTGDLYCAECRQLVAMGEVIPALGHDKNAKTVLKNAKTATCGTDGYTGDTVCADCGNIIEEGSTIPKKAHTLTTDVKPATATADGRRTIKCSVCDTQILSTKIYRISSVKLANATLSYTGGRVEPQVIAEDANDNTLTNYVLSYDAEPVEVGAYVVTITFTGDYDAVFTFDFRIEKALGANAPVITGVTKVPNGISVNWEADETQFDGYEIKVMNGDVTLTTSTVKNAATKTKKLTGLRYSSGSAIVKIRGYKTETADGVSTKVYSDWSNEFTLP